MEDGNGDEIRRYPLHYGITPRHIPLGRYKKGRRRTLQDTYPKPYLSLTRRFWHRTLLALTSLFSLGKEFAVRLQSLKLMQRAFNAAVAVLGAGVSVFYPRCVRPGPMPAQEATCVQLALRVLLVHICSQKVEPCSHTRTLLPRYVMRPSSIMWVYRIVSAADEPSEHAMKVESKQTVTPSKAFPGPLHTCCYLYCM